MILYGDLKPFQKQIACKFGSYPSSYRIEHKHNIHIVIPAEGWKQISFKL